MNPVEYLKEKVKDLPSCSGVYKMLGKCNKTNGLKILYIGKAKNLPNRVKSYTKIDDLPSRLQKMVSLVCRLDYEVTNSDAESLILEAALIRMHKPPFNILLKDDKSHPYICLETSHEYPRIYRHRGKKEAKNTYFGPFSDKEALENVISILRKVFAIRVCSNSDFKIRKRPCLEYQIKRCSAPCVGIVSREQYLKSVSDLCDVLSGKSKEITKEFKNKMEILSDDLRFEEAAVLRDKVLALEKIWLQNELIDFASYKNCDCVIILENDFDIAVEVFTIRGSLALGGQLFFFSKEEKLEDVDLENILETFLLQYYDENSKPENICSNVRLSKVFCNVSGVKLLTESNKKAKELVDFVMPNIQEKLFARKVGVLKAKENLLNLKQLLGMSSIPSRIEIYDNSHTQGSFFVGGMVVFCKTNFVKSEYRKFNAKLPETKGGDDYAMTREVLMRRFLNPKMKKVLPDLIIIDGGAGQLSSCVEVLVELGLFYITAIGVSKGPNRNAGEEKIHLVDGSVIQLEKTDNLLYFLQNLRDEAHRFAITTHRNRRLVNTIPKL